MNQQAYRILIIEDSPEDREVYRRFLAAERKDQYLFVEADSAEEGLEQARGFAPDCVLLDYKLPGIDGLDLLHQLASEVPHPAFAVIMLTGQGDEAIAVDAMKNGASDYLIKSKISCDSLQRSVRNAIEKLQLQRQLAAKQAELERLATTDALTGLYNRRYFLDRLEQEVERVRRYRSPLSVLMIDVDHFKRVNDRLGHRTGDEVLTGIGEVLNSCLRGTDLAARYGGEEFCVLAASTDRNGAALLAERVRQTVAGRTFRRPDGSPFAITCSVGVAEADPDDLPAAEELLARADQALYQAKSGGRNRVCLFRRPETVS